MDSDFRTAGYEGISNYNGLNTHASQVYIQRDYGKHCPRLLLMRSEVLVDEHMAGGKFRNIQY